MMKFKKQMKIKRNGMRQVIILRNIMEHGITLVIEEKAEESEVLMSFSKPKKTDIKEKFLKLQKKI